MHKCQACGFEFEDNEKFCPSCGQAYVLNEDVKEVKEEKVFKQEETIDRNSHVNIRYSSATKRFVEDTLKNVKPPFSITIRKFVNTFATLLFFFCLIQLLFDFIKQESFTQALITQYKDLFGITLSEKGAAFIYNIFLFHTLLSVAYYPFISYKAKLPAKLPLWLIILSFFFNLIIFGVLLYEYIKY